MNYRRTQLIALAGFMLASPAALAQGPGGDLTAEEVADMTWCREEEKLARDVYIVLYAEFGDVQFDNIAASEQNHMNAVLNLIVRYDVPDPVVDDSVGAFTNPVLADLFTQLTERGLLSRADAFRVGLDIEKLDIDDLNAVLERTERNDLINVYTNLRNGSYNHLAAYRSAYDTVAGCRADLDEDGVLDLIDIGGFVGAFIEGDSQADLAPPFDVLDLADLNSFVNAFITGCP